MTHTVEQMNKVIADFNNYPESGKDAKDPYYYAMRHCYDNNLMKYHSDWGWLHGAWNKVYNLYLKLPTYKANNFVSQYKGPMKNAMITGNITDAHRILYEAIVWLNSIKQ